MLPDWQLKFNSTGMQLDDANYHVDQLVAFIWNSNASCKTQPKLRLAVPIDLHIHLSLALATTTIPITTAVVTNLTTPSVVFHKSFNLPGSRPTTTTSDLETTLPSIIVHSNPPVTTT